MGKPAVWYGPYKAMAEPIRLCLAAQGIEFDNETVDMEVMKQDLDTYTFGQCPRYTDDDMDLVQSPAIMRYLGRKHSMYGVSVAEATRIDQLLDGLGDMKSKLVPLVYMDEFKTDEAKQTYWESHAAPEGARGKCKGAHCLYLDAFIKKHGKDGFAVGDKLSIADLFLFDIVDILKGKFGEQFDAAYPALAAHHAKIAALPNIAAYLASDLRPAI